MDVSNRAPRDVATALAVEEYRAAYRAWKQSEEARRDASDTLKVKAAAVLSLVPELGDIEAVL